LGTVNPAMIVERILFWEFGFPYKKKKKKKRKKKIRVSQEKESNKGIETMGFRLLILF